MRCNVVLVLLGITLSSADAQQTALLTSKQVSVADDSSMRTSVIANESDNVLDFYVEPPGSNHGVTMAGRFLDAEIYDLNAGVFPPSRDLRLPDFSTPGLASSASDANKDYNVELAATSEQPGQPIALSGESADDSFNEADVGFLTQPTAKTSGSLPTRLVALGGLCWLWLSHRRKRQLNRLGVKPR